MKSSTTPQVREWLSYISTKKPEVIYSDRSILGWHTVSVSIKRNTRLQPLSECLGPLATLIRRLQLEMGRAQVVSYW